MSAVARGADRQVHRVRRPRPVADLPDVFLGTQALAAGLLKASQLRGPHVQRVLRGVYRPTWVPHDHVLACRAAALVVPPGTRLTGRSLATVRGVPLAGARDPVEVVVPHGVELRHAGIAVRRASRGPLGDQRWEGILVAHPHRMAFDLCARHDTATATAHLDAVVRAGLVDADRFAAWLLQRRDDDVRAARRASLLVDGRAESLPESRLRVVLVTAGIDVEVQHRVTRDGRTVARLDLAVRGLRLGIDYDGAWHALREQLQRDRQRLNDLQAEGWVVVHVTAAMLRDPASVVAAVRQAMLIARPL